jgi:hypothetical protein
MLTVGGEHGGSGLGKIAMCVVSEALAGGVEQPHQAI